LNILFVAQGDEALCFANGQDEHTIIAAGTQLGEQGWIKHARSQRVEQMARNRSICRRKGGYTQNVSAVVSLGYGSMRIVIGQNSARVRRVLLLRLVTQRFVQGQHPSLQQSMSAMNSVVCCV
jgi:hypothetical protein